MTLALEKEARKLAHPEPDIAHARARLIVDRDKVAVGMCLVPSDGWTALLLKPGREGLLQRYSTIQRALEAARQRPGAIVLAPIAIESEEGGELVQGMIWELASGSRDVIGAADPRYVQTLARYFAAEFPA